MTQRAAQVTSLVVLVAGLTIAACDSTTLPTDSPSAATTHHLALDGIELDYPADWTVHDRLPASTGFGQVMAIIGTLPWGPCAPVDINCHYEQRLEPGQISVQVGRLALVGEEDICELGASRSDLDGRGPDDAPAAGSLTRIDGRPAIRTDYDVRQADYYHSDEWRHWTIAAPGSRRDAYTIQAMYRGPGIEEMRVELDQLIATIRLGEGTSGNPTQLVDCGPPFPP